jgi:hypothetical protein
MPCSRSLFRVGNQWNRKQMRKPILSPKLFPAVIFCLLLCAGADAPMSDPPSLKIIEENRHILAAMKESHYSHETHVDESAGVYDVDCSGLLCYVLRQVAPEHLAAVPASRRHGRPLALQFYQTFIAASADAPGTNGWRHIMRVADAQPGDAFVWRFEQQEAGKDTGHVMIVDEAPVEDGDNLYRVRVIDSCESPHSQDTRGDGSTGIGRGTMWFVVDDDGHPIGYHWKLRGGKTHEMQIAIGRAVPSN